MASNNSGVQIFHRPLINKNAFICKDCGLSLNSAESLDVHVNYHKENLLQKWATQAATTHSEETNNNNPKAIKREFIQNHTLAAADSSDSMNKKSPEYSRATPETIFGHPPSPQSFQSASSPYQNHDNSAFSPNFPSYQIKQERPPTPTHYQNYNSFNDSQHFFAMEANQNQQYLPHDFPVMHKAAPTYRYRPYPQPYERPQPNSQVSSSSPAYPLQPTPSPSPKQCEKCGYVCDSAPQLAEHISMTHPPTPYHHNQHFFEIKTEDENQSEILDLDSHKVHQVYPEEEKRQNGDHNNPHSVSALLNTWQNTHQKLYEPAPPQLFQNHQMPNQDFLNNSVPPTVLQENPMPQPPQQSNYRSFEHLEHIPPQPSAPVISSTQVQSNSSRASGSPGAKSANWKSNEARRPKTYNCTACNKWFTSSGHLKRHYNTTLHKNAVKSSGQPDPASLPISTHHHPARDSVSNKEDAPSPADEDTNSMPSALLQQMQAPHIPSGSPPNGEAGLSPNTSLDSRGLLSLNTPPNTHGFVMGQLPPHMMSMENSQFPMYPNELAPHVMQDTVTSNHSITGEFLHHQQLSLIQEANMPLPSFSHLNSHRYLVGYSDPNVGGGGLATTPYSYNNNLFEIDETRTLVYKTTDEEYQLTDLTMADPAPEQEDLLSSYSAAIEIIPPSPEKAHIQRDYEENSPSSPQISSTVPTVKLGLYKCVDCDKNFNKACYLTQHNKTFHCGDKPFKCSRCGKRFSNEETHEEHASKHAGDKPHKCDRCPKQFNHKTDLRRHMCLHTGQKPFTCTSCGKGFIRKDHMLKHCETHYRKTHNNKSR